MAMRSGLVKLMKNDTFFTNSSLYRLQSTVAATSASVETADEYSLAKPYSQIPGPKGLPLLGNALEFGKKENLINAVEYHRGLLKQFGPIYKFRLPNMDIVFISSAEDSQTLYTKDGRYPNIASFELFERVRTQNLKHLYSTPGLLGSNEEWYKTRTLVQQDMMRPKSAMYYIDDLSEIMDEVAAKIEAKMDGNMATEINMIMYEFALEAIGVMFIGSKLGVLQGNAYGKEMIEKVQRMFELFFTVSAYPPKIANFMPSFREYVRLWERLYLISKEKIDQALEKHKVDGSLDGTILAKMVERCGPNSDIPYIMSNDALLAGVDTTGNSASFILYHLAAHPEKQEKLYEEIVKVVGKDGKMTESALADMRFLKACQTESSRLTPVAMGTARSAGEDMVLSGYQIPKGTFVLRLGVHMSNDERYFNDPDIFRPERWIRGCPEHEKQKNPFANIPFGHGPRACIGQRFARLEIYMLAFKLVQKYKMSLAGPDIGVSYLGIGSPNGPLKLKFEKRA